ncbi:lysosomal amino acid transporter 1 homolog isoform X2 [Takifugu flavidus]|uniref:lysosomal amino acid transporter 1 homolog isoform X2 n=1 Tax=Takifugu flavidus TaxID=433684 RepID=UPI0025446497|nr:lysosomal amino acid transporter 1 homolog isoform X2 [Takifugu flavidus]XP_056895987.1 lysosomal amino acid transporter 1 homolog isoform X2 [Takifugu flavidus]XP_056895988.1 lysosomal amino acid transporter 1 homolog isoform X2 [Takifugu flavidus]
MTSLTQNIRTDGVLTRSTLGAAADTNFTSLCPNGSQWVWEGLGECAQDARDMASIYLGLLSILCFMVSSIPQCYSSCKTGNMNRALSIWFLLLWLGGDSCNLIGSFLADQLPLQTYTAIYYVFADLGMLSLYFYYKIKNKMAENRTVLLAVGMICVIGSSTSWVVLPGFSNHQQINPSVLRSRTLLSTTDYAAVKSFPPKEIVGFSIGSVSSVLYLCSRLPQIFTNFKRKSTEGVSYFLFALVILGNTLYGLSILLKNPDWDQGEKSYLVHHLPWLIGSLGTLTLDLIISLQFMIYRRNVTVEDGSIDETTVLITA